MRKKPNEKKLPNSKMKTMPKNSLKRQKHVKPKKIDSKMIKKERKSIQKMKVPNFEKNILKSYKTQKIIANNCETTSQTFQTKIQLKKL